MALMALLPMLIQAQVMKVYQKDGNVIELKVKNIDRIEFEEEKAEEEEEGNTLRKMLIGTWKSDDDEYDTYYQYLADGTFRYGTKSGYFMFGEVGTWNLTDDILSVTLKHLGKVLDNRIVLLTESKMKLDFSEEEDREGDNESFTRVSDSVMNQFSSFFK